MREEPNTSTKFLQSYLYTKEFGNFFVSTIHRKSSCDRDPFGWYYETIAWKLDKDKHRTDMVAQTGGLDSKSIAFQDHIEICRQLELKGEYKEEEENEE